MIPRTATGWSAYWLLILCSPILIFMGLPFVMGRLDSLRNYPLLRGSLALTVALLGLALPFVLIFLGHRWEWCTRLRERGRWPRWLRLSRLAQIAGFMHAFPHRDCEHRLLRSLQFNDGFLKAAGDWPAGTTIIVNGPKRGSDLRPAPITVPFEPQELRGPMDALMMAMTETIPTSDASGETLRSFGKPHRWSTVRGALASAVGIGIILYFLGQFLFTGGHWTMLMLPLMFVASLLSGRMRTRNWWIVPGGMLFREQTMWRRETRVGLVTPVDSTLVLHPGEGTAVLAHGGKPHVLYFAPRAGLCLLAAWTSALPAPAQNEILAFFGPDAKWWDNE